MSKHIILEAKIYNWGLTLKYTLEFQICLRFYGKKDLPFHLFEGFMCQNHRNVLITSVLR